MSSNARAYLYTANHTDISYRLVDVRGREIMQGKSDLSYALISIEITALPSGIYFLEATIGDKVFVERLNMVVDFYLTLTSNIFCVPIKPFKISPLFTCPTPAGLPV